MDTGGNGVLHGVIRRIGKSNDGASVQLKTHLNEVHKTQTIEKPTISDRIRRDRSPVSLFESSCDLVLRNRRLDTSSQSDLALHETPLNLLIVLPTRKSRQ